MKITTVKNLLVRSTYGYLCKFPINTSVLTGVCEFGFYFVIHGKMYE